MYEHELLQFHLSILIPKTSRYCIPIRGELDKENKNKMFQNKLNIQFASMDIKFQFQSTCTCISFKSLGM